MSQLKPKSSQYQSLFADYCRKGEGVLPPGAREDRMPHYFRLITNIFGEILEDAFPVLQSKITEDQWSELTAKFQAEYPIQEHQSVRLPREFAEFVQSSPVEWLETYPFAHDLVDFEWLEMDLYFQKNETVPEHTKNGSATAAFVINPYVQLKQYNYPVFENLENLQNAEQGQYFVLGLRRLSDHKVHFIKLNPLSAAVVEFLMHESSPSQRTLLKAFSEQLQADPSELEKQIQPFLDQLVRDEFIVGWLAN